MKNQNLPKATTKLKRSITKNKTINVFLFLTLLFLIPSITKAQKWDQVSLSITPTRACHEPGKGYDFNFSISIPSGNNIVTYKLESGPTKGVTIDDVYGKSSIYISSYQRSYIKRMGGSRSGRIRVTYDDDWDLKNIKLGITAVVTYQKYDSEKKKWVDKYSKEFDRFFEFCLRYLATPHVINLDGNPISSWEMKEPNDCRTMT